MVKEFHGKETKRYKVTSFIDKFVHQKLADESKKDLHIFLATYFSNKLFIIKREFSKTGDRNELQYQLSKYEKNIRHCLRELFRMEYFMPDIELSFVK